MTDPPDMFGWGWEDGMCMFSLYPLDMILNWEVKYSCNVMPHEMQRATHLFYILVNVDKCMKLMCDGNSTDNFVPSF